MVVVLLLHLAVVVLLILQHERRVPLAVDKPIVVSLLPLDQPEEPTLRRDRGIEKPREQSPQPPIAYPVAPPPLQVGQKPAPVSPPPAAPPIARGAIVAGEGDAVYDLDTQSGGAPGFDPPRWVHRVTNDEFFPLVDEDLLQASLEVEYRMQCAIGLDTRVKCRVLREVPFYPGLRRAVLAAVPLLRMAPARRDGRPIDGQQVEFLWRITVDRGDVRLR